MNYSTGEVNSLNQFYDVLASFMTGSGWTLYDNIPITGSRDRVFFSSGSTGKQNMYYRLSSNEFNNMFKDPADAHVVYPYVFIRGYHSWNPSTHTGSGEYGVMGPLAFSGQEYNNTADWWMFTFQRGDGSVLGSALSGSKYLMAGGISSSFQIPLSGPNSFDGRRKIWNSGIAATPITLVDLPTSEFTGLAYTSTPGETGHVVVCSTASNSDTVYSLTTRAGAFAGAGQLLAFDVAGQAYFNTSTIPAGTVTLDGRNMVWDGGDYIYVMRTNTTTGFYRYSISQNSWTTLTVTPATVQLRTPSSAQTSTAMVYVPNSVTGIGQDVIYALPDAGTTIWRYDVTSNAWRSAGSTGELTSPITIHLAVALVWDRVKYLYVIDTYTNKVIYRSDLTTAPGTFSMVGSTDTVLRRVGSIHLMNYLTSKVRSSNSRSGKYFLHGDVDSVRVVYRVGTSFRNGEYYWGYLGKYDTSYATSIATVTTASSPGPNSLISVDDTTNFYSGQIVMLANWSGSSHFEKVQIRSVSAPYSLYCSVTSSFPVGTKVGMDPAQCIVTGDHGIGIAPIDSAGYHTDLEPAWYYVNPEYKNALGDIGNPSSRGEFLPARFAIYNNESWADTSGPRTRRYNKLERLGYLKNVYVLTMNDYPSPRNEDFISVDGSTYICFNPREVKDLVAENHMIVIGPVT